MTSYKSYKNLVELFEGYKERALKKPVNLGDFNSLRKSDLINAYYKDDSEYFDGDMLCDAMCDPTLRNAIINLMDMGATDINKITVQRQVLTNLLWNEIGHAIQGLWDEFNANENYMLDSIGDDECSRYSRCHAVLMGGV